MNPRKRFIASTLFGILLTLFLTSLSCQSHELVVKRDTQTAEPTFTASLTPAACLPGLLQVPFDTLKLSENFGSKENMLLAVFTSPEDVESIKGQLRGEEIPQLLKSLDYQTEFAILVARGKEWNSSFQVTVNYVLLADTTINLCATFQTPQPEFEVLDYYTYPYHLIRLRKSCVKAIFRGVRLRCS